MSSRRYRSTEAQEYWFREGCYILERLNAEADPACSIARARVLPGQSTRGHWLVATTERYLIVAGRGEAEIGGERYPVESGDVLLIPPDVPQCISNTGADDLVFLAVCTPRFRPENYRS